MSRLSSFLSYLPLHVLVSFNRFGQPGYLPIHPVPLNLIRIKDRVSRSSEVSEEGSILEEGGVDAVKDVVDHVDDLGAADIGSFVGNGGGGRRSHV
jgi:hypothetical protein